MEGKNSILLPKKYSIKVSVVMSVCLSIVPSLAGFYCPQFLSYTQELVAIFLFFFFFFFIHHFLHYVFIMKNDVK